MPRCAKHTYHYISNTCQYIPRNTTIHTRYIPIVDWLSTQVFARRICIGMYCGLYWHVYYCTMHVLTYIETQYRTIHTGAALHCCTVQLQAHRHCPARVFCTNYSFIFRERAVTQINLQLELDSDWSWLQVDFTVNLCQLVALRWATLPSWDWPTWNSQGQSDLADQCKYDSTKTCQFAKDLHSTYQYLHNFYILVQCYIFF